MQFARRFRLPAFSCSLAVLVCSLISRPFAEMGIADDGPYVLTARTLASTGHISYNGWVSAMLGWQLYLGAAFIKLFGFSFTAVRMSGLLVAMALAFLLQRTLVRTDITERNATIGVLAFVLSPLYLSLAVTFMTDLPGLFVIVLCLYGCLRSLQASTSHAAIAWLCFAVATNAIGGTCRQIAWLGILVIVPPTLWLLRSKRRVLIAGVVATLLGLLFILACTHWFSLQPYIVPPSDHVLFKSIRIKTTLWSFSHFFLNFPFLLLPLVVLFSPQIRNSRPRVTVILSSLFLAYLFIALYPHPLVVRLPLDPTFPQHFGFNTQGMYDFTLLQGKQPILFGKAVQALLTIASLGGLIGLIASFLPARPRPSTPQSLANITWTRMCLLLGPFTAAYMLIILPRPSTYVLFERYSLPLLYVALVCLVRYYQERIQPQLPLVSLLLIATMAVFAVAISHNTFALYRARVALAAELRAHDVPDTSVDNGWEYNFGLQIQRAGHINESKVVLPTNAFTPTPPLPAGTCPMEFRDETPLIDPLYGISFEPNACYGPAPFAPIHYSRWLASGPGTLYVVNYRAHVKR
jgi:Dolichyl-phosphate-mannose-protein mannosyltransferase